MEHWLLLLLLLLLVTGTLLLDDAVEEDVDGMDDEDEEDTFCADEDWAVPMIELLELDSLPLEDELLLEL